MQDVIAILIVAVAAGMLLHRVWRRVVRGERGGCSLCSNCLPSEFVKSRPLVPLDQLQSSAAPVTDTTSK